MKSILKISALALFVFISSNKLFGQANSVAVGNQKLLMVEAYKYLYPNDKQSGIYIYWLDKEIEFFPFSKISDLSGRDLELKVKTEIAKGLNSLYEQGWKLKTFQYTPEGSDFYYFLEKP